MTLELYPGYLNLGGNEVINNPRLRGLLEANDCPTLMLNDTCDTLEDALTPPELTPFERVATNIMINPSFEDARTGTTVRTNLALNPGQREGGSTAERLVRNGWSGAYLTELSGGGLPAGLTTAFRIIQPASSSSSNGMGCDWYDNYSTATPGVTGASLAQPVTPSTTVYASVYIRCSVPLPFGARLNYRLHDGSGAWVGSAVGGPVTTIATANTWTRLTLSFTVPTVTTAQFVVFRAETYTGDTFPGGVTIDQTGILIEVAGLGTYFDGSTPGTSAVEYAWIGDVDASPSTESTANAVAQRVIAKNEAPGGTGINAGVTTGTFSITRPNPQTLRIDQVTAGNLSWTDAWRYYVGGGAGTQIAIAEGGSLALSAQYRTNRPRYMRWRIQYHDSAGVQLGVHASVALATEVGEAWQTYPYTWTAPAGTVYAVIWFYSGGAIGGASAGMLAGDWIELTKPMIVRSSAQLPFFDGSTLAGDDYTYRWTGVPDASASEQLGVAVSSATPGSSSGSTALVQSSTWTADRDLSMRIVPLSSSSTTYATVAGSPTSLTGEGVTFVAGKTYTILATGWLAGVQGGVLNPWARSIVFLDSVNGGTPQIATAPNVTGELPLRLVITVPPAATSAELRLYNGASLGNDMWWDAVAIVEGDWDGEYFDGASLSATGLERFTWAGAAETSASYEEIRELVLAPDYSERDVADAPWYDLDLPSLSGGFYGAYAVDVTQLHDSSRQASISQSVLNGGTIGRMRLGTKELVVRAMLFAESTAALEYGRAWLESVTLPGACGQHGDRCGTTDLTFYADCPPDVFDYPVDGEGYSNDVLTMERFLHGVAVTAGPTTTEEFVISDRLVAQVVEFTITSERPWVYGRTRSPVIPQADETVVIQDAPFNLVEYPSAELPGADVIIARNYSLNPSLEANVTGWSASAATVSGTSPAAYFTSARVSGSPDIAANGIASMRGRILGNGSTEVAASVADITITQDVALPSRLPNTRMSVSMWAAAIVSAGSAVTSATSVRVEVEWRTASATIRTDLVGTAANATERAGHAYSAVGLDTPSTATIGRVRAVFRVNWRSSATSANNSDIKVYADALTLSIP